MTSFEARRAKEDCRSICLCCKVLLQHFVISDENNPDKSLPNAGKLIGIAERFIALALVLGGQFTALGFIMTAKSILRFEEAKHNEYVLVGTLLSFGIAVLTGIAINIISVN